MDENQGVIEEEVQLPAESPTTNETTEEVPQSTEQEASDTDFADTQTAESNKGANQRIRELNQRAKQAEQRAKSLEEKIAELTAPVGVPNFQQEVQFNPQEPIVAPGEDIDVNELNRRIQAREQNLLKQADARSELRQRQTEAIARHNSESKAAIQKYPQLNPDSDSFDPELSESITEATENLIKSNPYSASVEKFVDKLMKPYSRAVAKEVGKVTENVAKQVSETALRPTSIRKQEKPATEKSIAELEQELGIVQT